MRIHPRRLLALAAAACLSSSAAAQTSAPAAADLRAPDHFLIVTPLTAFPDPIAVSLAVNGRGPWMGEAGAALVAPGAWVRAGMHLPVRSTVRGGSDLLGYVGYRGVAIPLMEAVHGPSAGVGFRSWPRGGGWGWQVDTGMWITNQRLDCNGSCEDLPMVLPEVRLAAIRAR